MQRSDKVKIEDKNVQYITYTENREPAVFLEDHNTYNGKNIWKKWKKPTPSKVTITVKTGTTEI